MAAGGVGMNIVKVERDALLTIVKGNRDKHREIFLDALKGFRAKVIDILEQRLADARAGRRLNVRVNLPTPIDQTREYDRVIKMLEMSVEPQIELTQSEFSAYVMDDWSWKHQFTATNSAYTVAAIQDSPIGEDDDFRDGEN